jgi:oligopeptide/dipeptide ABC transporter, ATP-binding protein, C-terminal domain
VTPLLAVRGLTVRFGPWAVVEDVSFEVAPGEVLAIVGESGCGKSMTALALMRLVPEPGRLSGQVVFEGRDLLALGERAMRQVRGGRIAMIFQEPMTSLNPVFTVGHQIAEALTWHGAMSAAAARAEAARLLSLVEIPKAAERLSAYPHELSGGMRQRVMIAIALACRPALLIADEPTTALDATVQAQIIDLLRRLRAELGMAVILITHDLGVVSDFADRVAVMYAARIVETAPEEALFAEPRHPYTEGLLASLPRLDTTVERLASIPGQVPPPFALPPGCRFAPRCAYAKAPCAAALPPLLPAGEGRAASCIRLAGYALPP